MQVEMHIHYERGLNGAFGLEIAGKRSQKSSFVPLTLAKYPKLANARQKHGTPDLSRRKEGKVFITE